jgi:sporulation protein YlmC with PRC-barrel domain
MKKTLLVVSLTAAACLSAAGAAQAQVAGSVPIDITVTETAQVAMGWSVKKGILGKTVYNDAGARIGKVADLIISPDRNVSYVIVGAGGFIGIGRHDVAIPIKQIQDHAGKLVMAGATKDTIQSMPAFNYASDTTRRDQFVADADRDMARARAKLAELQQQATAATADAKVSIDHSIAQMQADLKTADDKLTELKHAGAAHWRDFESSVNEAMARLRHALS